MSVSQPSGQPTCSVPRPRSLPAATGTASRMRAIWPSLKPPAASRSPAAAATRRWVAGDAVVPWAATPTIRRVPCADATAETCSV